MKVNFAKKPFLVGGDRCTFLIKNKDTRPVSRIVEKGASYDEDTRQQPPGNDQGPGYPSLGND
jgi:hypothetical protein